MRVFFLLAELDRFNIDLAPFELMGLYIMHEPEMMYELVAIHTLLGHLVGLGPPLNPARQKTGNEIANKINIANQ